MLVLPSVRPGFRGDCGKTNNPQRRHEMATSGRTRYSVYSGRRAVGVREAWSAAEAIIEYLHALGCQGDEITRMRSGACVWRGATFTAAPATGEPKR